MDEEVAVRYEAPPLTSTQFRNLYDLLSLIKSLDKTGGKYVDGGIEKIRQGLSELPYNPFLYSKQEEFNLLGAIDVDDLSGDGPYHVPIPFPLVHPLEVQERLLLSKRDTVSLLEEPYMKRKHSLDVFMKRLVHEMSNGHDGRPDGAFIGHFLRLNLKEVDPVGDGSCLYGSFVAAISGMRLEGTHLITVVTFIKRLIAQHFTSAIALVEDKSERKTMMSNFANDRNLSDEDTKALAKSTSFFARWIASDKAVVRVGRKSGIVHRIPGYLTQGIYGGSYELSMIPQVFGVPIIHVNLTRESSAPSIDARRQYVGTRNAITVAYALTVMPATAEVTPDTTFSQYSFQDLTNVAILVQQADHYTMGFPIDRGRALYLNLIFASSYKNYKSVRAMYGDFLRRLLVRLQREGDMPIEAIRAHKSVWDIIETITSTNMAMHAADMHDIWDDLNA